MSLFSTLMLYGKIRTIEMIFSINNMSQKIITINNLRVKINMDIRFKSIYNEIETVSRYFKFNTFIISNLTD